MSSWGYSQDFSEVIGEVEFEFAIKDQDCQVALVFFKPFKSVIFCKSQEEAISIIHAIRSAGSACCLAGVKLGQKTNT